MIDDKMLTRTVKDIASGTAEGQTNSRSSGLADSRPKTSDRIRHLSKTHADHWPSRLRKRSFKDRSTGRQVEVPDWQVRLKKDRREGWFNLGTANKAAAALLAKEIYIYLQANGWDATLAKYKPETNLPPRINLTIGEFLSEVNGTGYLRPRTYLNYQNCLRTMVSEIFGIKAQGSKFDYVHGGNQDWVRRIDATRLERVTPARVIEWQRRRLKQAGNSPVGIASAKRTANSYVRCARSLFGKEILKRLRDVQLPTELPFNGVELFESGNVKYISKLDVNTLISAARVELKPQDQECYKVFLLGLLAGMRKAEIDLAEWRMVDFNKHVIRLEETEFLHLKTHDSAGEIAIDPEVSAELLALKPEGDPKFVISSEVIWGTGKKKRSHIRAPRNDSARIYYRCNPIFARLNVWLRSKGIKANKPLHELRKEIGAQIATQHGIYAASKFLRHSDITTTARHYADHRSRISPGLGKLLVSDVKPTDSASS